ncbi:hypothetical protein L6452_04840 [Arctium lappa]|uniref:Uncharacterized protein n=1 Tax=Arctium lappa TaxID=4217 RepID=A0ACB9EEV4_ARCLA|nr:hypothetical protein L6452_04840 [Arctium lappa]
MYHSKLNWCRCVLDTFAGISLNVLENDLEQNPAIQDHDHHPVLWEWAILRQLPLWFLQLALFPSVHTWMIVGSLG